MKTYKLILTIYFLVMVIILAFLWKYLPIWESLLLGIWAIVSFLAGYIAKAIKKSKEDELEKD